MSRRKRLPELTDEQKRISQIIYDSLDYMYCDNCRYNSEIEEENSCEDCHRKYNGWAVSRSECNWLARAITDKED